MAGVLSSIRANGVVEMGSFLDEEEGRGRNIWTFRKNNASQTAITGL